MSLRFKDYNFVNRNMPLRACDDLYLRGPVILARDQVNPLTEYIPDESFMSTWQLATNGSHDLHNGQRFENAIWRLWAQQKLGIARFKAQWAEIELPLRCGGTQLLVPIVVSHDTCHGHHELPLISKILSTSAHSTLPIHVVLHSTAMRTIGAKDASSSSIRPCLKAGSNSDRGSDSPLSPLSSRSTSSSPALPRTTKHVYFNMYVERSLIRDDFFPNIGNEDDVVSKFDADQDEDDMQAVASQDFPSTREKISSIAGDHTDEEAASSFPSLPRTETAKSEGFVRLQALPAAKISALPGEDFKTSNVVFSPPMALKDLQEQDLIPSRPIPQPKLKRTVSSHDIVTAKKNDVMDSSLGEMGNLGGMGRRGPKGGKSGTGTIEGGFIMVEDSQDENTFEPTIIIKKRKQRDRRRSFSLGAEGSTLDSPSEQWVDVRAFGMNDWIGSVFSSGVTVEGSDGLGQSEQGGGDVEKERAKRLGTLGTSNDTKFKMVKKGAEETEWTAELIDLVASAGMKTQVNGASGIGGGQSEEQDAGGIGVGRGEEEDGEEGLVIVTHNHAVADENSHSRAVSSGSFDTFVMFGKRVGSLFW